MAPEVGFGAVFPCISLQLSSLHLSNQANSVTTRANSFTAVCWQICWHSIVVSFPTEHCSIEWFGLSTGGASERQSGNHSSPEHRKPPSKDRSPSRDRDLTCDPPATALLWWLCG